MTNSSVDYEEKLEIHIADAGDFSKGRCPEFSKAFSFPLLMNALFSALESTLYYFRPCRGWRRRNAIIPVKVMFTVRGGTRLRKR